MTNEQAIIELRDLISDDRTDRENEALLLAIEKLREQPTDEWCTNCKEYDHEKNCCPRFNKVIRETLKDAEQPTGEWIEETVPVAFVGRGNRQCRCSNCGHGDIQAKTQEVPYCWFCGAKMKMTGGETNEM